MSTHNGPDPTTEAGERRHVRTWRVDVHLFESGEDIEAHASLVAGNAQRLDAWGSTRGPEDGSVPEIGDELAVARALRALADRLGTIADDDVSDL